MARPQRAALLLLVSVSISGWLSSGADAAASPKSPDDTPLVGAYYFSWYNLEQQWEKFPRSDNPTLGEYDQSDPKVVTQHHAWAKRGGIDFFAMAWSGAGSKHVEWCVLAALRSGRMRSIVA
ncbi:hypothetical protein T484DRAFT_1808977 [Baffinella frigidus]|nr:hypothetical protein T484DRAFT_1808977 [Cryptophyta sp. CCMP2293]